MEKDMNKEADIVEETAVVNEVTDSSEEIVAVNAAEDISKETTAVNAAAEEQITDSNISHSTLPPKKTRGTAAKIVVLALCCSLVGGATGAGGVVAVDRLLISRNTEAVSAQATAPATQGFRVRKGSRQVKIKVTSDSGKLTIIPDAGAATGTTGSSTSSGSTSGNTSSTSSRKKTTIGSSSTSSKKSTSSSDSSESKTRKKPSSST